MSHHDGGEGRAVWTSMTAYLPCPTPVVHAARELIMRVRLHDAWLCPCYLNTQYAGHDPSSSISS